MGFGDAMKSQGGSAMVSDPKIYRRGKRQAEEFDTEQIQSNAKSDSKLQAAVDKVKKFFEDVKNMFKKFRDSISGQGSASQGPQSTTPGSGEPNGS